MPSEAEDQKESPKPKSSLKKILILVVAVVLLAAGGAGAYFKFFAHSQKAEEKPKEQEQAILKEMDTFIVNLSDPGGKRFLKLTMKARMNSLQGSDEFTARVFEMRDIILMILSSKEYEDISKPSDKLALKQELITAINNVMRKGQVQDLYFQEFLIQ